MNKRRREIIAGNQISEVQTLHLGQYDQKVLLEGKTRDLPILITLHGGPGFPIPFCVGSRGLFPDLTDRCILVCWDQYGSGSNNAVLPADFHIEDIVAMTSDLISALRNQFPQNRIYLFGMSWGSVLTAKVAQRQSENLQGIFTYGQVLRDLLVSDDTITAILDSKAPPGVKGYARAFRDAEVRTARMFARMSGYVRKYTSGYTHPKEPKSPIAGMIRGILTSPDYRLKDALAIVSNGYAKNTNILDEVNAIDLREDLRQMRIPYHILQGETDIVTSTRTIKAFVDAAGNTNLTCTIIPNAAHMPGVNGMRSVMDEIERMR